MRNVGRELHIINMSYGSCRVNISDCIILQGVDCLAHQVTK